MAIMASTKKTRIRSANMQDGIDYEVRREHINAKMSQKMADIMSGGEYRKPTDEELAELRALAASR
jgi:hypothetical protein